MVKARGETVGKEGPDGFIVLIANFFVAASGSFGPSAPLL
jgi:hypothetical protein